MCILYKVYGLGQGWSGSRVWALVVAHSCLSKLTEWLGFGLQGGVGCSVVAIKIRYVLGFGWEPGLRPREVHADLQIDGRRLWLGVGS